MRIEDWTEDARLAIETGSLNPRSLVGSVYILDDRFILVGTWRGSKEWVSKWIVDRTIIRFDNIEGPDGIVVNWGNSKSIRRFIPSRHISIIEDLAARNKLKWEEPL